LSSPQNPLEGLPGVEPAWVAAAPPPARPKIEDPPWSGWDVLLIVGATVAATFFLSIAVVVAAKLLVFRSVPWIEITRIPEVLVFAQLLAYAGVFVVMYRMVKTRTGTFWQAIRWDWPESSWLGYLLGGAMVFFVLAGLAHFLPMPRNLPIDRFFENARQASIMSVFAMTVAPLMEELFFRGFLYPVLARRLGMATSILLTSVAFGLLHGDQLKFSWAAVLIIFLVGVALTTVRALTKSVAASFLLHVGYNGTLSVLLFISTSGFRHLERLNRQ
jgi:uncharacterized protein